MNKYTLKLKCACGNEEDIMQLDDNALQIFIGSPKGMDVPENSKFMLDCSKCGAKLTLEIVEIENLSVPTEFEVFDIDNEKSILGGKKSPGLIDSKLI